MSNIAPLTRTLHTPSALAALDTLVQTSRRPHESATVPTGFRALDEVLQGGLRPGELVAVAGKPGRGKTIAALQWARNVAASGYHAVYVCYEHDQATLLTRLLALELGDVSAGHPHVDQLRLETLREGLQAVASGLEDAAAMLASDPLLEAAEGRLRGYGSRLLLVDASRARTDLAALETLVVRAPFRPVVLFVDYLQKVPTAEGSNEPERVALVTAALKDLALRRGAAVVVITAADQGGLESRRLHLHHSRGSTALAYECDVAVVLNDKVDIVSRLHLAYDTTRVYDFQARVVFSVEKNRRGLSNVDLEFVRDFGHYRFDPEGRWVTERLWDEGSVEA